MAFGAFVVRCTCESILEAQLYSVCNRGLEAYWCTEASAALLLLFLKFLRFYYFWSTVVDHVIIKNPLKSPPGRVHRPNTAHLMHYVHTCMHECMHTHTHTHTHVHSSTLSDRGKVA